MGVSKLKKRDDADPERQRVQKKVEAKPLTMQDALRERLARRNE
jgi:hypothetical protein